ncbi:hypothetical protein [Bacillus alkalicellulosilyticus]|uniref:hypothetical protein n=1 Tax=Alkalihalobacterium alkalicellulosilyticum TaxID=1912214 RepID=UPI000996D494|nr:hypothetical protein [Bacillus alkalicellulosilyticus]
MKPLYHLLLPFFIIPFTSLLLGCNTTPTVSIDIADVEESISMPEEMPSDFNFLIKYGVGALNEINTFTDTYTKDLIEEGTIKTNLKLTNKEMQTIYQEMKNIELLSTIQSIYYVSDKGEVVTIQPSSGYYLEMQLDGELFKAYWMSDIYDEEIRSMLGKFVHQFLHDGIISQKKEYIKLPEAHGGYL